MKRALGLVVPAIVLLSAATTFAADAPDVDIKLKNRPPATDLEDHIRRATVMVLTKRTNAQWGSGEATFQDEGQGTGSFINGNGLVLTNNHVVDPDHQASLMERWWNAQVRRDTKRNYMVITDAYTDYHKEWEADVIFNIASVDLALVQLKPVDGKTPETPHYLEFIPEDEVKEGMSIRIIGFPGGRVRQTEAVITRGNITRLGHSPSGALNFIETDAEVHGGNSGGPCTDAKGRLIGVVTYKMFKEGEQRSGSGASPTHLVKAFIKSCFDRGIMPADTDIKPLMHLFLESNGTLQLPGQKRGEKGVLVKFAPGGPYPGARAGEPTSETITLPTGFGDIEVPFKHMAYLFVDGSEARLYFDGGDKIVLPTAGVEFELDFGDQVRRIALRDVERMDFPVDPEGVTPLRGEGVIIEGDDVRIGLSQVDGKLEIEGKEYTLDEIAGILISKRGARAIRTARGELIRGQAEEGKAVFGNVEWADKPVPICIRNAPEASIRTVDWTKLTARGRLLIDRVKFVENDIEEIAELLDRVEWQDAGPLLETARKKQPRQRESKRQLQLCEALYALRSGEFETAKELFGKLNRDKEVGVLAMSYVNVLDAYESDGYQFHGKSISDPYVFWSASSAAARNLFDEVQRRVVQLEDDVESKKDKSRRATYRRLEGETEVIDWMDIGKGQPLLVRVLMAAWQNNVNLWEAMKRDYDKAVEELRLARSQMGRQQALNKIIAIRKKVDPLNEEFDRIRGRFQEVSSGFSLTPPKLPDKDE